MAAVQAEAAQLPSALVLTGKICCRFRVHSLPATQQGHVLGQHWEIMVHLFYVEIKNWSYIFPPLMEMLFSLQ